MSKSFIIFMFLLIVFTILIFTFPDFSSKGLDYMTEEYEPYIFIGLLIFILVFRYIKEKFFKFDSNVDDEKIMIEKIFLSGGDEDTQKTSKLQRWLQIILGVLLLPICLVFIFISIVFIIESLYTATSIIQVLLTIIFGSIILLGSLWFTNITIRHILNKPRTKTLDEQLPPWVLYFMSLYFIGIPIISIITGAFFEDLVRNLILLPIFIIAGIDAYKYAKFKASVKDKK